MAEFVRIASLDDVAPGQARVFRHDDYRLAVCRTDDGDVFVIDDVCTHDGGPLGEGELDDHEIECPRHGARFDVRTGEAITAPAVFPVDTYPSRVVDGYIEVELEE